MRDPYKIILKPVITEKSTIMKDVNKEICFEVDPRANKIEIQRAIEKLSIIKLTKQ